MIWGLACDTYKDERFYYISVVALHLIVPNPVTGGSEDRGPGSDALGEGPKTPLPSCGSSTLPPKVRNSVLALGLLTMAVTVHIIRPE